MNFLMPRETGHDFTRPAGALPTPFNFPCTKGAQFYDFNAPTPTAAFQTKCAPPGFSKYWWDGVGYYSPAICPSGYTVGCTRFDKNQGPPVEKTETAMQCVPTGFTCGANPSFVTAGATTAVMIQIRWAESDLTNLATHPIVAGASPTDESVYIPFDLRDERPTPTGAKGTGHQELKRGGIMEMGRWFANRAAAEDAKRAVSGLSSSGTTATGRSSISYTPDPDPYDGARAAITGGAIAGIVIGVICGLALIGGIIFWAIRVNRQKKNGGQAPPPMTMPSQYGGQSTQPQYMPELQGQQAHTGAPSQGGLGAGSMLAPGTIRSVSPGMTAASVSQTGTPAPPYAKHEQQNAVPHSGAFVPVKPAASPQPFNGAELDVVRAESYPAELSEQTRAYEVQNNPPQQQHPSIPELGSYSHGAAASTQPQAPPSQTDSSRPTSSFPQPWANDPMSPSQSWIVPDVVGAPSFVGQHSRGVSYVTASSERQTATSPAPPSMLSQPESAGLAQQSQWAPPAPAQGGEGQDLEQMRSEAAKLEARRQRILELQAVEEEQRQLQARIAAAQGGQQGGAS